MIRRVPKVHEFFWSARSKDVEDLFQSSCFSHTTFTQIHLLDVITTGLAGMPSDGEILKPLIKTLFSTILFIKYASKGPDQCSNHFIDIIFWENWQRNINSINWYLRTACHLHCVHIQNCSHIYKFQQGSCRRHFYIFLAFQHTHWYLKLTRLLFIRKRRNLC